MKTMKKLKLVLILLVSSFVLHSCLLDDDEVDFGDTPVLVQFANSTVTANFIKDEANPETFTYDIPVTIIGAKNQPLNRAVDLSVSVDPSSTATEGVEYNLLSNSVTISAGQMSTNVQIEVLSENLDPDDPKTLVLAIETASETISESFKTSVDLQAACPFDITTFYGSYDAVEDGQYEYVVEIMEGPVANTLLITNLYETGGETVIELSQDPTDPTIIFRSREFDAVLYVNATYGDLWATTLTPESSSYKSCDNSMFLDFKRCVGAGCFGGSVKVALTKQ